MGDGEPGVITDPDFVREQSRRCFEQGSTALEASKRIEFGPFGV